MYININGEKIFYKKSGYGSKNFVLIHNAGGNHQFFTHQIKTLNKIGCVYAFDLPGHRQSQALHKSYTTSSFSDLIDEAVKTLQLNEVYLIGLNNGANVCIELSLKKPTSGIQQLILIDPILFMNKNFVAEIEIFIQHFQQPGVNEFIDGMIDNFFVKTDVINKQIANTAFKKVSNPVAVSVLQDLILWSKACKTKLLNISVPTLTILTDEHHCTYQNVVGLNPLIQITKVVGSKCWATLEVPEQINAMIKRVVELKEAK